GDGRKALSRLSRRAHEGPRPARASPDASRPERPWARAATRPASTTTLELEAAHRRDARRAPAPDGDLGDPRLPLVPKRRCEGERAAAEDVARRRARARAAEPRGQLHTD